MALRKLCKWCLEVKTFRRDSQIYCSTRCAGHGRAFLGNAKEKAKQRKRAAHKSALIRGMNAEEAWKKLSAEDAYKLGYGKGYYAGKKNINPAFQLDSSPPDDTPCTGPDPSELTSEP